MQIAHFVLSKKGIILYLYIENYFKSFFESSEMKKKKSLKRRSSKQDKLKKYISKMHCWKR